MKIGKCIIAISCTLCLIASLVIFVCSIMNYPYNEAIIDYIFIAELVLVIIGILLDLRDSKNREKK